jgi:signal transduction histidine kinase/CheY-like chemotaxis protein
MTASLRSLLMPAAIGGLTLLIFFIDALTPLSIAIAVLYGAVILMASFIWMPRDIIVLTGICLLLTLLAYGIGHRLDFFGPAFGRCLVSLTAISIIAFLALKGQKTMLALKQREAALEQVNRRKDDFLAMLAHELRNPLAPINAAAHMMKLVPPHPRQIDEISNIIIRQSDHLNSLVDDLLDVSRLTRRIVTLKNEKVDMKEVVSDAIEQVRPMIEANRHELVVRITHQRACVLGDYKRLVQIVANLLNNAAKYTPPGGKLTLQLQHAADQIILEVIDSGIGIPAELLPHVFDLFTQAERSIDRSQGGLGIGLALVKSLVELHHGSVFAHSEGAGLGSRFTVNLKSLDTEKHISSAPAAMPEKSMDGLRILVVDDNVDAARTLAGFLQAAGHDVTECHHSGEGLALAEQTPFDAYLLDIGLPGMDGNQLARKIRRLPEASHALFVAITGYGQHPDRQAALDSGFDHYFVKPANPLILTSLLSEWQQKHRASSPMEQSRQNQPGNVS